jgi:hypothetical protein
MHEHAAMTSSNEDWAHQIDAIYKAEGQIESVTIEHRNITINVVDNKNVLIRFMYSYGMEETRAFDKQELQQLIELLNKIESQME